MAHKRDEANEKLKELCAMVGFDLYIFDDPSLTDKCLLRYRETNKEIDAVAVKDNIVFLIDAYSGENQDFALSKVNKFALGLNKKSGDDIINNLLIQPSKKGKKQRKDAELKLKEIKDKYSKISKAYAPIIRKLCFYPQVEIAEDKEDKYLENNKVYCIDKELCTYFFKIEETLGAEYLLKEMFGFFSIEKKLLDKKSSSCGSGVALSSPMKVTRLELNENKLIMYSSAFPVRKLIEYTTVFRVGQKRSDVGGFQRMVAKDRIEKIRREYLSENQTFPNNIIVALDPELYKNEKDFFDKKNSSIRLYDEFNSLIIIDGQHRFFSFNEEQFSDREVLVTFVFFMNIKTAYREMYKMFYKINRSQTSIEPSIKFVLTAMINSESEEAFWFEVFKKLNNTKGIFKNKVSFKEKQLRYRDEKGIVSVIQYGGLLTLNKSTKKFAGFNSIYPSDIKKNKINFAFNLVRNYFSLVYDHLIIKEKDKDYLAPREIGALLRLLKHFIIRDKKYVITLGKLKSTNNNRGNNKKAIEYFKKIIGYIDFEEIVKSDYSASNWAAVEGLMFKHIRKRSKNFGDEKILSKKGYDNFMTK